MSSLINKVFFLYNPIAFLAILLPNSLANLVAEFVDRVAEFSIT